MPPRPRKACRRRLEFAKAEYDRVRPRWSAKDAASREELETSGTPSKRRQGRPLKAEADIEQAKLDLDFTKITAPIAGKISRTQVDEGNLVNAGGGETLLTTIVSVDPIYVYFNVDERSLLRYRSGLRKEAKPTASEPRSRT